MPLLPTLRVDCLVIYLVIDLVVICLVILYLMIYLVTYLASVCWYNSMCMVDTASQLESAAPELLPLWVRYGRQLPEELARDVNLGGVSTLSLKR